MTSLIRNIIGAKVVQAFSPLLVLVICAVILTISFAVNATEATTKDTIQN